MESGELPAGWDINSFEDVISRVSNGIGGNQNKTGNGIPVSRIETIACEKIDFSRVGYISEIESGTAERYRLLPGDILFSHINSPAHLGKTAIYTGSKELFHGINLLRITVNPLKTNPAYFRYNCKLLRLLGVFALNAQHAVNQSSINQKKLAQFEIPLAPLAEQKVIAEKLDALLAQVDSLKARLDAIPAVLKRFRQAVLSAAVSGKLTEDWRGINEKKWLNTTIEELSDEKKYALAIGPFGSNLKVSDYRETGHPLVFVREIRANSYQDEKSKFVDDVKFAELFPHRVSSGDLLITKMGDPPGDVSIYPSNLPDAIITSDCIKLTVNTNIASIRFIYFLMQSEEFRSLVLEIAAGVAQQKVSLTKFRRLSISLPPLPEQTEIVRRVEQLFAFADQVEARVKAAQGRTQHLTQSILAKAFRGELTADWREAHASAQ